MNNLEENDLIQKNDEKIIKLSKNFVDSTKVRTFIFLKKKKEIKKDLSEKLKSLLSNEAKYYKVSFSEYNKKVENIISKYNEYIEIVGEIYSQIAIYVAEQGRNFLEKEIKCIDNIIEIKTKMDKELNPEIIKIYNEKIKELRMQKSKCDVLVQECISRFEWCITELEKNLINMFTISEKDVLRIREYAKRVPNTPKGIWPFKKVPDEFEKILEKFTKVEIRHLRRKKHYKVGFLVATLKTMSIQLKAIESNIKFV